MLREILKSILKAEQQSPQQNLDFSNDNSAK